MRPTRPSLILALAAALAACQSAPPTPLDPGLGQGAAGIVAGGAGNVGPALGEEGVKAPDPNAVPVGQPLTFVGITERDGKPLVGAAVTVLRLDTNQPVATATTLEDGSFAVNFSASLPATLPIKVVATLNGEALGAVVAGGPLAIVAGGAGNIVAGGAGNIVAGGAGNIVAGGAGNIVAGGAGNIVAGGAGNIVAGGAGNIVAGGAGNIVAGGAGNIVAGGAGNIVAGGAGNIVAGGAGNIVAGGAGNIVAGGAGNLTGALPSASLSAISRAGSLGSGVSAGLKSGNVLSGGVGNVIVAAPASLRAAQGIVAGGAGNIVAGGAGNIVAGGAGNIVAGGAGNIVAGGAGNLRLAQASAGPTIPVVKLSMASTAAVLILEKRIRAYAQSTGTNFIQAAAMVADAVFEGLTAFMAKSPTLNGDEAAKRLVAQSLAQGLDSLPPTVARNISNDVQGIDATFVDAAVRLGLVVLGTATATNSRPSEDLTSGYEVGNATLPPVSLPSSVGTTAGGAIQPSPGGGGGTSSSAATVLQPGQNPVNFPAGGAGALGNPGQNGPGPVASSFGSPRLGPFSLATNPGPAVYEAGVFADGNKLYVVGGATSSSNATTAVRRCTLASDGQPGAFSTISNLPAGLSGAGVVVLGRFAYLIGGRDIAGAPVDSIYRADLDATTPTFTLIESLSTAVDTPAVVATASNRIVVVGGREAGGLGRQIQELVIGASSITVLASGVPEGWLSVSTGLAKAVAVLQPSSSGRFAIQIQGGYHDGADPSGSTFEILLNADGSTRAGTSAGLVSGWTINGGTGRVLQAAVQDPSASHVYFTGGKTSSSSTTGETTVAQWRFPGNDVFSSLENLSTPGHSSLNLGRTGHGMVLYNGKVIVVGGRSSTSSDLPLSSIEIAATP